MTSSSHPPSARNLNPLCKTQVAILRGEGKEDEHKSKGLHTALLEAGLGSMMLQATELYRRARQDRLPSRVKGASVSTSSTTMGALTLPEQNALMMLEGTIKSLIASGLVVPQEEWKRSENAYWGVGEGASEAVSDSESKERDSAAAAAAAAPLIRWAINRISM